MLLVQWYHKGLRVAGMQCIRLGRGGAMGGHWVLLWLSGPKVVHAVQWCHKGLGVVV
jgi:hypothetical protein